MAFNWKNLVEPIQGLANVASTAMTNAANMKLAKYSFEQQKQMVEEQNRYNSPLEQMKRYEEAGLNPALIYGSGQASAGNQSSLPKYEAPTLQAPDLRMNFLNTMQLMLQAKKTEAEIDNINASTARYKEDTRTAMLRNAWESFVSGKPVDGFDFAGSRKLLQNDLNLQGMQIVNTLKNAQTDLTKLNSKERSYFVEVLLPLSAELKQLQIEGASYDNVMKAIDATLWRDKRTAEMNSSPFKILGPILQDFIGTDSKDPVESAVKSIIRDPLSWKNSPIKWGIDKGKNLYQRFRKK